MKVTKVESIVLLGRYHLVRVFTDEGIDGVGEVSPMNAAVTHSLVENALSRLVVGESPFDVERIWQRMFAARHDHRHPGMDSTPAISAIEIALWDLIGKATNQPIYNLLGGRFHEKLRAYAYMPSEGVWEDPARAGDVARRLLEAGNSACKIGRASCRERV